MTGKGEQSRVGFERILGEHGGDTATSGCRSCRGTTRIVTTVEQAWGKAPATPGMIVAGKSGSTGKETTGFLAGLHAGSTGSLESGASQGRAGLARGCGDQ